MNKTLYIVRGLPGSGKSTLAKNLVSEPLLHHHEADQYYVGSDGVYRFDPDKIGAAHSYCRRCVENDMENYIPRIAVSNTFTTLKEIQPYLELCKLHGYTPVVIHCENNFGNIHSVPEETLIKMKNRWQKYEIAA